MFVTGGTDVVSVFSVTETLALLDGCLVVAVVGDVPGVDDVCESVVVSCVDLCVCVVVSDIRV
jgi:hypothetical protein